jgi:hypothetical protein
MGVGLLADDTTEVGAGTRWKYRIKYLGAENFRNMEFQNLKTFN